MKNSTMTLDEIMRDIHALEEDLRTYERKYGVRSETFYESYIAGDEPADDAWVLGWNDWAGAYEQWLRGMQQYHQAIHALREQTSLGELIRRAAHREPLPISG